MLKTQNVKTKTSYFRDLDVAWLVEDLTQHARCPGLVLSTPYTWNGGTQWRLEDQKFESILSYIANLRPVCAT